MELRVTLSDYDSHDDMLDKYASGLSAAEHADRRSAQDRFASGRFSAVAGR